MRPMGEVTRAILDAVRELSATVPPGRGVTLAELTAKACVGRDVTRQLVPTLKRRGHLSIVAQRKVPNRNRPVAEYSLPAMTEQAAWPDLSNCLTAWAR